MAFMLPSFYPVAMVTWLILGNLKFKMPLNQQTQIQDKMFILGSELQKENTSAFEFSDKVGN